MKNLSAQMYLSFLVFNGTGLPIESGISAFAFLIFHHFFCYVLRFYEL